MHRSRAFLNFFPLGRSSGPFNRDKFLKPLATDPGTNTYMNPKQSVARRDVVLKCEHCRYFWSYDRLAVYCPVNPTHKKIERSLKIDWIWDQKNPAKVFSQLQTTIHPKDGRWLSGDHCPSRGHREPKSVGITSRMMSALRDRSRLSTKVSGLKGSRFHWKTYFPYPS